MTDKSDSGNQESCAHPLKDLRVAVLLNGTSYFALAVKCQACGQEDLEKELRLERAVLR